MKFVELAKSLKEGVAPVYLIEGEEAYFRDHAVESIRAACHIANPSLNDVRYEGDALKGDIPSLVRALETLPFFDDKRLVRVYEFYPTEREWETYFKEYSASPNPSTVFLIVNTGKKAGAADLRKKAGVTYVDCGREDEEKLARMVYGVAKQMGLAMDAVRLDETASACFGINIVRWKVTAFTMGNVLMGMAGALYAMMLAYISPANFTFSDSLLFLSILLLGGMGNCWGVLLATSIMVVLPEKLQFIQEYRYLLYSLLVLLMIVYRPMGLLPRRTRVVTSEDVA